MQAKVGIRCKGCGKYLGDVNIDTADMPDELQAKVNGVILDHREDCKYYGNKKPASVSDAKE